MILFRHGPACGSRETAIQNFIITNREEPTTTHRRRKMPGACTWIREFAGFLRELWDDDDLELDDKAFPLNTPLDL